MTWVKLKWADQQPESKKTHFDLLPNPTKKQANKQKIWYTLQH